MPDRAGERIGTFVITSARNLDPESVVCANCGKWLAALGTHAIDPSPETLFKAGAVAWPNFGWFCSLECERIHSQAFHLSCVQRQAARPPLDDGTPQPVTRRFRSGLQWAAAACLAGLLYFGVLSCVFAQKFSRSIFTLRTTYIAIVLAVLGLLLVTRLC